MQRNFFLAILLFAVLNSRAQAPKAPTTACSAASAGPRRCAPSRFCPRSRGRGRTSAADCKLSTSQAFHLNRAGLERADLQQVALGREARIVNMSLLGQALTTLDDPPVKAMVVYNSNPAAIAPDQNAVLRGLRREDLFTVVLEQFQTDTADYADIVLPVTTFLEHTDLYLAYGHYHLQLARPALAAPGETRSNVEIFRLLAGRMGFDDACFADTDDDMIRTLLDSPHPFLKDITLERLDREHSVRLNVAEDGAPFLPFAEGNFGTPDGKCHFNADTLDYQPPVESRHGDAALKRKYPLELISPKNDDSMNSTFGHRNTRGPGNRHAASERSRRRGARHPPCRPGARLQRSRRLPADGQRG